MSWPKILGASIVCLGLWCGVCDRTLAQSIQPLETQPNHPRVAPANASAVNIDQIVLPPVDDVPEEILRTEIIFDARSPLDGAPLSAADYAQLQAELADSQITRTLSFELRFNVFLLQARRSLKPIIPFLP
ncbi:hypothetical protein [Leptolyngbya ectocarpi]|uniref:hypothetical protein n=1 Tax=Leptolyngbya ectocarpi TaxID=1202 RepID=UPI001D14C32F|nr:hypothetical protein [Leptolyngbya ectocarpi]